MTPQQRLDYLLAPAGIPQDTLITVGHITDAVGMDASRLVVGTVQAGAAQDPLLQAALHALYTTGMRLDLPERQDMIDQLAIAGEWPNEVRDAVKALGIDNRPRWQVEGRAEEPTLESMQDEINQEQLRDWWTAQQAVVSEGIFNGTITTQTAAINAIEVD